MTLHKGGGSRSFMTMIMTIWLARSGVWIYQVVTGVTSVVGVPSTHLVITSAQKNLKCVDEQCPTFPMAKPKCLTTDFTNLNGIYKSHQTNV